MVLICCVPNCNYSNKTVQKHIFPKDIQNSGSCYLFHCGPPEDFKCKFTHHVNYSSAVLSINRHLPDLESQIKLTKHVQDLTKLRKPELESSDILRLVPVPVVIKPTPTATVAPAITKEVLPIDKQTEARKCHRYQFECRSTGECIAIYNACDGIPQCADGSDEAHELGCPAPEAVASAAAQTNPPPTPRKIVQPPVHQTQPVISQYGREGELVQQSKPQQLSSYQQLYRPQAPVPPIPLQPEADFIRPISDSRPSGRTQFEPVLPNYFGIPSNWGGSRQQTIMNQQVMQQVPPLNQYQDGGNQVFSHKSKTLQNEGPSQMQYPEYPGQVPNYYGENYRQPIQQENWPSDETRYPPQPVYHPQENVPQPIVPAKTEGTSHIQSEPVQKNIPVSSETGTNSKHVQEKLAHDLKHSKDNMEHGSNQKAIAKSDTVIHQPLYAEPYKMTDDTQDGLSHIPRGAILSLTLGLIITGVMAVLIGCRLRVVRRRLRKGGKGYAHDADYLVNGMYL